MTYSINDGKQIIANMVKEKQLQNWSNEDLGQYLTEKYEWTRFDSRDNTVQLDGWFNIPLLEAILIALYNEQGAMRG